MDEFDNLEYQRDKLESAIAQSMTVYGVTASVGRIYGALYFSSSPMTLKDIQSHVAMSKASVSNGVRSLMETEMVTKVWKKNEKQDYYVAEKDFFRNFIVYFVKMLRKENSLISKAIEHTEPALMNLNNNESNQDDNDNSSEYLELLQHAKTYLDWTTRMANAMESGEIFDHFPKEMSKGDNK